MKKILLLFLLIFFAAGWSPVDMFPAFKTLRSNITTQLNDLFEREVTIESISGTIVNQIELNNVAIARGKKLSDGTIIHAKQIVINYNPFKLATSRGNIVPAISKITIIEPEIVVERSAEDKWNMAELIPKVKNDSDKKEPLKLNADVQIINGYGTYLDHMGWGEPLNGRTFTSKIKDLNCQIKIAGAKISLDGGATSVIDSAVAFAKIKGRVNTGNGKYYFVANIKDVDIAKWGYYTMNIPHFKPLTGKSDMKLTMTNPPPRKKGQPILFDGQFYIRDGEAIIFDNKIEKIYGFASVHDEDARFKNLAGYKSGLLMIANGRLYDFGVANYDIDIDVPKAPFEKLSVSYPQLSDADFAGNISTHIHIGGNFGRPLFNGTVSPTGSFYGQKMHGDIDFSLEGPILNILPSWITTYNGKFNTYGIVDFTSDVPAFSFTLTSESIGLKIPEPAISIDDKFSLISHARGSLKDVLFDATAFSGDKKEIDVSGTVESGVLSMDLSGKGITMRARSFGALFRNISSRIEWDLNSKKLEDLKLEGSAVIERGLIGSDDITGGTVKFHKNNASADMTADIKEGGSFYQLRSFSDKSGYTTLNIDTVNSDAGELKLLDMFVPKELTPVTGSLEAHIVASFEPGSSGIPDISKLRASGNVSITDGGLSYEKLDSVSILFDYGDNRIDFGSSNIKMGKTDLTWSGSIDLGKILNIDLDGQIDLGNLKPFTIRYGRLFGRSKLRAHLDGPLDNPNFNADFDVKGLRYNDIILDRIYGKLSYDGKTLLADNPVDISLANDEYILSGRFDIKKLPLFSIKFEVKKGDLGTAIGLADEVNKELSSKHIFGASGEKPVLMDTGQLVFPAEPVSKFYSSGNNTSLADELKLAIRDSQRYAQAIKERVGRHVDGKFSGYLDLKGTVLEPSGYMEFRVNEATIESYSFDEAFIKGSLENGTFEADSVYIKKLNGILSINGTYNPRSSASLEISATSMPMDFLSLIMPWNKQFYGTFDMNAGIHGQISALAGQASMHAANVSLGGVPMDDISTSMSFRNNTLYIENMTFIKDQKNTSITGTIPLEKDGLNVSVTMEGEGIGLLTLPVKELSWITGEGKGSVQLTGNLSHPKINGYIALEKTSINIPSIDSNLDDVSSKLFISNNLITSDGISAVWKGNWTQGSSNKIRVTGYLNLAKAFDDNGAADLNLKLSDGDYLVDLPNLYKGDVTIKNAALVGPLSIRDSSKMPKFSGHIDVSDGVIALPDFSKSSKNAPVPLDLKLNIGKNTYVVAGDVKNLISTDISNLLLNLEIEGQNILISGDLDSPKITGSTVFKQGTINILNREFSLMSDDRQKEVYPAKLAEVKDNSAQFKGGSMPYLNLAAEVTVKQTEAIGNIKPGETPTYRTTDYLVVSRMTGIPYSEDKDQGLKLDFDAFIQDSSKQPPELTLAGLDQDDIKVLLLPDFIKVKAEQNGGQVAAGDVLADYLNSRLNSYLLRDVERNLAKSLELESLTLEYNFGRDIKNMLPSTTTPVITTQSAPETMYGIGVVKGFFDRFYIDMKYAQAVEEQSVVNNALLNYQLTYKLSPLLSIVYYREPYSFIEDQSNYYKVTLKAGYQL